MWLTFYFYWMALSCLRAGRYLWVEQAFQVLCLYPSPITAQTLPCGNMLLWVKYHSFHSPRL